MGPVVSVRFFRGPGAEGAGGTGLREGTYRRSAKHAVAGDFARLVAVTNPRGATNATRH